MSEYITWMIENPVASIFLLMIEFALIMGISKQKRFKPVAYVAAAIFILQDLAMNLIICTIIFLDLPKEYLVTARMKRYKKKYKTKRNNPIEKFRYYFSVYMCKYLNLFDEGHC